MPTESVTKTRRGARILADAMRVATLLSGVAVVIWLDGERAVAFFVIFVLLLLPRFLAIAPVFDAAFCVTLLLALWMRQSQWDVTVAWVDEIVHFVTPGAGAVAAYLMLASLQLLPDIDENLRATRRFSLLILVTTLGLGLAALWEFFEWVSEQLSPETTFVGYTDTISDLALGGLGALVSGVLLVLWDRVVRRSGSARSS